MPNYSGNEYVYITGCDSGFGRILTKKLDKLGYGVFSGVYLKDSVDRLKSECSDRVIPLQVDVSKEASCNAVAVEIETILKEKNAKLMGIVNNAGILVQPAPVEWTPVDAYQRMFNVNVMGTVMTTKALLPLLRQSQGRIVNVASIAGRVGLPTQPAYCASKYAVEGYTDVLRRDMLAWGVTVHLIEPGVFSKTGLYQSFQTGLDQKWAELDPKLKEEYGEGHYKFVRQTLGAALADFGNTNSDLVPQAMVHALTSDKPQYRYRVGHDSKYLISFVEKCHESTQDLVFGQSGKVKYVGPATAPKGGRAKATARYEKNWPRFLLFCLVLLYVIRKVRQ